MLDEETKPALHYYEENPMIEEWRTVLYPLGYLATLIFGCRLLMQWLQSEARGQCVVNRSFWRLSLIGNGLLLTHSLIQIQFHVALVQACNGVIAWRNLNLMQDTPSRKSFKFTCLILLAAVFFTIVFFFIQGLFLPDGYHTWFRVPSNALQWRSQSDASALLHATGFLGVVLFNSRFWIQWWNAEKAQESFLGASFWWTSLLGELLCLVYFLLIQDMVNLIGPLFGIVPYVRNLVLSLKTPLVHQE